jgi:hypothetical protein
MDTKLTVRVSRITLEKARLYARTNNTTLTALISNYLERLTAETEPLDDAPIVRQITGLLSPDVSRDDYGKHLAGKYGG